MGFLEICVDMMNLSGIYDIQSPAYRLFGFVYLLAALFLARNMKKPEK